MCVEEVNFFMTKRDFVNSEAEAWFRLKRSYCRRQSICIRSTCTCRFRNHFTEADTPTARPPARRFENYSTTRRVKPKCFNSPNLHDSVELILCFYGFN